MEEQYHIWKGNVKISIDNDVQTVQNVDKFNTCKHRSEKQEMITIPTCCSSKKKPGYICHKRQINFLSPSVCGPCHLYESKETNKGGNPSG